MARPLRYAPGGMVFHVLNRPVGRRTLEYFYRPVRYAQRNALRANPRDGCRVLALVQPPSRTSATMRRFRLKNRKPQRAPRKNGRAPGTGRVTRRRGTGVSRLAGAYSPAGVVPQRSRARSSCSSCLNCRAVIRQTLSSSLYDFLTKHVPSGEREHPTCG